MNYLEATVLVRQNSQDSKNNPIVKKLKKYYLVDAETVTEAEARVVNVLSEMGGINEFQVMSIVGSRVVSAILTDDGDELFETIVEFSLESSDKVKKIKEVYLVEAQNIKDVQGLVEDQFKKNGYSQEFEVIAIKKSKIAELVTPETTELKGLHFEPKKAEDLEDGRLNDEGESITE